MCVHPVSSNFGGWSFFTKGVCVKIWTGSMLVAAIALMFACLVGNGLIIIIFYPRVYGSEQCCNSFYARLKIILAFSDMLYGVTVYPVLIYYLAFEHLFGNPSPDVHLRKAWESQHSYWVYINGSLLLFAQTLGASIVCVLTSERFCAIIFPFWHRQMR